MDSLSWTFARADPTALESRREFFNRAIKLAKDGALPGTDYPEGSGAMVEHATMMLEKVGSTIENDIKFYYEFCEKVIAKLFAEAPPQIPEFAKEQFKQIKEKKL